MVAALGGPPTDFVENFAGYLAKPPQLTRAVAAPTSGHVSRIATREIGLAVVELGGGRRRADDVVNPAVGGLTELVDLGVKVEAGDPLAVIHADDAAQADAAEAQVLAAYEIGGEAPEVSAPVMQIID